MVELLLAGRPMSPNRPPRLPQFDYTGMQRYFVTVCTENRLPVFSHGQLVNPILGQLVHCASICDLALFAYCFMPDHLHALLVAEADSARFLESVRRFKQFSAFAYRRETGRQLWQTGYFERVLRDDESTAEIARYILENPMRAGLTRTVEEYPFSGSTIYAKRELVALWEAARRRV